MSKKKYRTDILYPKSTFWMGFGSVLNISGKYFEFNYSESAEEADFKAFENDWGVIGDDIKNSIKKNPISKIKLVTA